MLPGSQLGDLFGLLPVCTLPGAPQGLSPGPIQRTGDPVRTSPPPSLGDTWVEMSLDLVTATDANNAPETPSLSLGRESGGFGSRCHGDGFDNLSDETTGPEFLGQLEKSEPDLLPRTGAHSLYRTCGSPGCLRPTLDD